MAQRITILAAKPGDLSAIPRNLYGERREMTPVCCPLTFTCVLRYSYVYMYTHAHTTKMDGQMGRQTDRCKIKRSLFLNIKGNYHFYSNVTKIRR